MNLPEMSRLQSPSPHLANEIESMAYMDLLNGTGYNRFGQGLVGTYIQASWAQLLWSLVRICTWHHGGNQRIVEWVNLWSKDLPWSSTTTCGHGRVMVSVKLSSWQHCLYLFETHSQKDMYSYCCQEDLPIATSHSFHLKCQYFYQYAAFRKLYDLCQFNILLRRQMAFYTSINLVNFQTWIFGYGLAAGQLWVGMRIRGHRIYIIIALKFTWLIYPGNS